MPKQRKGKPAGGVLPAVTVNGCTHLGEAKFIEPAEGQAMVCEDCIKIGSTWVHLRQCLICGHIRCCDSSPHKHASKHAAHTGHPLARSVEPGEDWIWCYKDQVQVSTVSELREGVYA